MILRLIPDLINSRNLFDNISYDDGILLKSGFEWSDLPQFHNLVFITTVQNLNEQNQYNCLISLFGE